MATLIAQPVPVPSDSAKASTSIQIHEELPNRKASTSSNEASDTIEYGSSVSSVESNIPTPKAQQAKKVDGYTTYYPHPTTFKLGEHAIDDNRPLKVSKDLLVRAIILLSVSGRRHRCWLERVDRWRIVACQSTRYPACDL